jgi:transposase
MCCRATGAAFQFDWSEDWATIGGEHVKLQGAHIKLSHSRAFLVRAYLLQTHEMLFDAHWRAFRVFGGIPGRGIYDSGNCPPLVQGQWTRRRLLIVLGEASSVM